MSPHLLIYFSSSVFLFYASFFPLSSLPPLPLNIFSLSELISLELVAAMSVNRVLMQLHDSLEF